MDQPIPGKDAQKLRHIPLSGWKEIFKRIGKNFSRHHLIILSAGIAFFFFLSLFPAIGAGVSIYGLIMNPTDVKEQIEEIPSAVPTKAKEILSNQLQAISDKSGGRLGWGVVLSIILSLWSANLGTKILFKGLNIIYNEKDERNFFRENGLTLLFTLGGIVVAIIAISLIVGFPAVDDFFDFSVIAQKVISVGRWILLSGLLLITLALIYKYAPDRRNPKIRWVSHGALVAVILWILISWLLSVYVENFENLDKTYGSVASVVVLMIWFFISSILVLLGAELNAQTEFQTQHDTTIPPEKPMGEREGYFADNVPGK